jgi:flagellar basal-body rod protein FlgB
LASQHNQWLSVRQTVIAGNVANASTPNFKAMDIAPFETTLEQTRLEMTATRAGHFLPEGSALAQSETREDATAKVLHSGNSVHPEQQMMKMGEVNRQFTLNSNVVRSFHRMLLASAKG